MMGAKYLTKATNLAKHIISAVVQEGDTVIDATMGNGNDTLYLRKMVGNTGKVIAFDIQEKAIENTKKLLQSFHMADAVELIHDGHENMDLYVFQEVSAVMFNLGYLPKGDHHIVTKPDTTIIAIEKALSLLKRNGIITIAVYHGHEEGMIEKDQVLAYATTLDQNQFHVLRLDFINQKNNPPFLLVIEKK
ncbi:hypothetical protein AN619_08350 [Thermotalea metallivorans]|uniref:Uncharacterized protein n=2 Tax=Thermotalea metallivorans TaxID=520762 RepID=A0A140L8G8_9FIRM|nr:hypothetical protein AN619_08350 [Thermotalea metallivorans]